MLLLPWILLLPAITALFMVLFKALTEQGRGGVEGVKPSCICW
jgi:hypothetical protein